MDNIVQPEALESQDKWVCPHCNHEGDKDDSGIVSGETVCIDCLDDSSVCEDCDESVWENQINGVSGDRLVCDSCYENYRECDGCGEQTHNDDIYYCDICSSRYCEGCNDEHYHDDEPDERGYGNPEKGDVKLASLIRDSRMVGIEIEAVDGNTRELYQSLDRKVGVSGDGSLRYDESAVEIQTPPASADRLEHYIDNSTKALRDAGFGVNSSCGLHIHLDSEDLRATPSKAIKLFNTYYTIEPIIFAMLPKSRRDNTYCRALTGWIGEREFNQIAKSTRTKDKYYLHKKWYKTTDVRAIQRAEGQKYPSCSSSDLRYHGFNLHALLSLGHIELRYHNGTTNPNKIRNWIRFNLHLVNWATKNYNKLYLDILNSIPNESMDKKLNIFYRLFNVPVDLREYVSARVKKFSVSESVEDIGDEEVGLSS